MDKVYIVTAGRYSDFRNVGVYSNQEKAQRHHEYLRNLGEYTDIEEWDLDKVSEKIA